MVSLVRRRDAVAAAGAVEAGRWSRLEASIHPGMSPAVVAVAAAVAAADRAVLPESVNRPRRFASLEAAAASSRTRQEQPFLQEQAASLS